VSFFERFVCRRMGGWESQRGGLQTTDRRCLEERRVFDPKSAAYLVPLPVGIDLILGELVICPFLFYNAPA
jgi:hypothetical protein